MTPWTDDDEGLLWAYRIRNYLQQDGRLPDFSDVSALHLEPGEYNYVSTTTRFYQWQARTSMPESPVLPLEGEIRKGSLDGPFPLATSPAV